VNPNATVRIRVVGDKAFLTVKGSNHGASRLEFEYELPIQEANEMLDRLCIKPIIEKYRYKIEYERNIWEVDEFIGDNAGLVIAEVELKHEHDVLVKPDFIGDEVTNDERYYNSNLVKNPYKKWKLHTDL